MAETCGQGLVENSPLPAAAEKVFAAMAAVLEAHMSALDLSDESARAEHEVYERLAARYRRIAGELRTAAADMAAQGDLPMGRHDMSVMASPDARDAFARFMDAEEKLLALLDGRVAGDREMLSQMGT
jgi:hypothetical protein